MIIPRKNRRLMGIKDEEININDRDMMEQIRKTEAAVVI